MDAELYQVLPCLGLGIRIGCHRLTLWKSRIDSLISPELGRTESVLRSSLLHNAVFPCYSELGAGS